MSDVIIPGARQKTVQIVRNSGGEAIAVAIIQLEHWCCHADGRAEPVHFHNVQAIRDEPGHKMVLWPRVRVLVKPEYQRRFLYLAKERLAEGADLGALAQKQADMLGIRLDPWPKPPELPAGLEFRAEPELLSIGPWDECWETTVSLQPGDIAPHGITDIGGREIVD